MSASGKVTTFAVSGMSCTSCAAGIERALRAVEGVESATVNFALKKARVLGTATPEALGAAVEKLGYHVVLPENLEETSTRQVGLAIASALPVFILGMFVMGSLASGVAQAVLTAVCLGGPARGFFVRAAQQVRHKTFGMDVLVALGAGTAFLFSVAQLALGNYHALYFDSATVVPALVLLGKFAEDRARNRAANAVKGLLQLQPRTVCMLRDGQEVEIPIADLRRGMAFIVKTGMTVPTDGEVISGTAAVDESFLTGEAIPVQKSAGEKVMGASLVQSGYVTCRAEAVGQDTLLAKLLEMIEGAQAAKPPLQKGADRIASVFVPGVLAIAAATWIYWFFSGQTMIAHFAALAVLVVACPCALGLATPTAIVVATGRAAKAGVLIRNFSGFERLARVTDIIVDKTGTLTEGRPEVVEWTTVLGTSVTREGELWAIIAAVARSSTHPYARAVLHAIAAKSLPDKGAGVVLTTQKEIPGQGIEAELVWGGNPFSARFGQREFVNASAFNTETEADGSPLYFALSDGSAVRAVLQDPVKPVAQEAIRDLAAAGIRVHMATGDRAAVAHKVAAALALNSVRAAMTPAEKCAFVQELQERKCVIAMAGDGINDAPALAQADVGIAMGTGTDLAMTTADLILPNGDIRRIAAARRLAIKTRRVILQNFFWAFLYNVLAIPLAASAHLSPMIAGGAMTLSSLSVVLNSLRLRGSLTEDLATPKRG